MPYPKKDMKYSGGSSLGDGYSKSSSTGGAYAPGGQKWSSGSANVVESRLNKGGDKKWRGTRGKKKNY